MKYALLVHQPHEFFEKRDKETVAAGRAYGEALQAAGVFVGGAGLESPKAATTVSVRDGKRQVHDGPYAETKELLGGLLVLEARDLNHAVQLISNHPGMKMGPWEIRPAEDMTEMIHSSEQRRSVALNK